MKTKHFRPPEGFLSRPRHDASGRVFEGRFTCRDVQWTDVGQDAIATFTLTAQELQAAADSHLLWTDQDVQRGIRPALSTRPPRELPLAEGYPNPDFYIFDAGNADDMVDKLLTGQRLFLNPLVWNLRPSLFEAYWNKDDHEIYIYSGNIYLPDSHHRQQAILKATRTRMDSPSSFPRFSPDRQFKVELYFLSREDEGNYFFDKNQRPRPTSKSKAYDLTTLDDLSLLAKKAISSSFALGDNVNRVTDRLTAKNPQVVTLSTLREMMKALAPTDTLDAAELDGLANIAGTFYDLLAEIRPELGTLDVKSRRQVRERLIVDAAVMMHGYAALMRDFNLDLGLQGARSARKTWQAKLQVLSAAHTYHLGRWKGDLFDKANPLWRRAGIVKPSGDGRSVTVLNTGAARIQCGRLLREIVKRKRRGGDIHQLVAK